MTDRQCRWGILGTANIAPKYIQAMHASENATPHAIASRTRSKADAFASTHRVTMACDDYQAIVDHPDIDAVYIPLPTSMHLEWTRRCVEAGKHVLCEKPLGRSLKEVDEMIAACNAAGVQLMDGVMFMHHARLDEIRKRLPDLGERPTFMNSSHAFRGSDSFFESNIRVNPDTEPLGCVGDLAWYNVRFSIWVMDELPTAVRGRFHSTVNGVPTHATAELEFENGCISIIHSSFVHIGRERFEINGDLGTMMLKDFVHGPKKVSKIHRSEIFNDDKTRIVKPAESFLTRGCDQEAEMLRTMSAIAIGKQSVDRYWPQIARDTQQVIDLIMSSARNDGATITLSP